MILAIAGLGCCFEVEMAGEGDSQPVEGDQLEVGLLVTHREFSLAAAISLNQQVVGRVGVLLKQAGVKKIVAQKIKISPSYIVVRKQNTFNGMTVSQGMSFQCQYSKLKEGGLIDELIEAGVTKVQSVQWEQGARLKMYRQALDQAKHKAQVVCRQAGQQIESVSEIEQQWGQDDQQPDLTQPPQSVRLVARFKCGGKLLKKQIQL